MTTFVWQKWKWLILVYKLVELCKKKISITMLPGQRAELFQIWTESYKTGIRVGLFLGFQPRIISETPLCFLPFSSPHRLPHFSLSSVRQLSSWLSHHLLRTHWISLLQRSFYTVPQPRLLMSASSLSLPLVLSPFHTSVFCVATRASIYLHFFPQSLFIYQFQFIIINLWCYI